MEGTDIITLSPSQHEANRYFALVVNDDGNKLITTTYRLKCLEQEICKIDTTKEKTFLLNLFRFIRLYFSLQIITKENHKGGSYFEKKHLYFRRSTFTCDRRNIYGTSNEPTR